MFFDNSLPDQYINYISYICVIESKRLFFFHADDYSHVTYFRSATFYLCITPTHHTEQSVVNAVKEDACQAYRKGEELGRSALWHARTPGVTPRFQNKFFCSGRNATPLRRTPNDEYFVGSEFLFWGLYSNNVMWMILFPFLFSVIDLFEWENLIVSFHEIKILNFYAFLGKL